MMLVTIRFRLPLLSKVPVNTVVHGIDRLVVPSNTNCPPLDPFAAWKVNVLPLTLMLVNCGVVGEPCWMAASISATVLMVQASYSGNGAR